MMEFYSINIFSKHNKHSNDIFFSLNQYISHGFPKKYWWKLLFFFRHVAMLIMTYPFNISHNPRYVSYVLVLFFKVKF